MLSQVVACQMLTAAFCHFLALPRVAQGMINRTPQTLDVTKSQDLGSVYEIMRNAQGTAGTQVDCVACRVFPESEGIVPGTRQGNDYPTALQRSVVIIPPHTTVRQGIALGGQARGGNECVGEVTGYRLNYLTTTLIG